MRVTLIEVPYDSGRFAERMGRGPLALAEALPPLLAASGHDAEVRPVRLPAGFLHEMAALITLQAEVRREVSLARESGRLPVVLSGNCGPAALGAVAALGPGTGVLWLDAHGDFNTPETSPGGFLDGMALATLTGRCWTTAARSFEGWAPVLEKRVVLLGARHLDPEERRALLGSRIAWLPAEDARRDRALLTTALDELAASAELLYLHLDLDVLEPSELRANRYACPGGLTVDEVVAAIAAAGQRLPLAAVAVTAYDPEHDAERKGPGVASRLLGAVVTAASS
jgi:arginase